MVRFVLPDKRQALAPADKRILIAQFTTTGTVNGLINIHGRTKAIFDAEGNVESGASRFRQASPSPADVNLDCRKVMNDLRGIARDKR